MKKIFLLLAAAMTLLTAKAQMLEEHEPALVYYCPKTSFVLEFTYTAETQEKGIFANYAETLLGATDYVRENATRYTLGKAHLRTVTSTDYSRPHKVVAKEDFPLLLTINDKGLLTGYNTSVESQEAEQRKRHDPARNRNQAQEEKMPIPPFPEDVLKASNARAQAYEAAKQIFRLRETRMYLMNGEVEHAPADGRAMELVLDELNKQERALTELFIGKKSTRQEHKTVHFEPDNNGYLLFFSEENGFTEGDNIDADTIEVRMTCHQQTKKKIDPKDKKKKRSQVALSQIVYNIPGYCNVHVSYKGLSLTESTIPVAQLGTDVALPLSMFTGMELPKITFSETTGNITGIED